MDGRLKPVYRPDVRPLTGGRYEQVFTARFASAEVEHGVVILAFAEDKHEAIHGVMIASPQQEPFTADDVYVEFNNQGNGRAGTDVTLSLTGDKLTIDYSGEEVPAGRISYSPEADVLTDPEEPFEFLLSRVTVDLQLRPDQLAIVRREIDRLARNGVRTR